MHIKTIISVAALTAALGFTGQASAQMLAGQQLTEGDIARIQNYCNDLEREENAAVGAAENDDLDDDEGIAGVDEDLINFEWCVRMGYVERVGN